MGAKNENPNIPGPWASDKKAAHQKQIVGVMVISFIAILSVFLFLYIFHYRDYTEVDLRFYVFAIAFPVIIVLLIQEIATSFRNVPRGTDAWFINLPFNKSLYLMIESELGEYLSSKRYNLTFNGPQTDPSTIGGRKTDIDPRDSYGQRIVIENPPVPKIVIEFHLRRARAYVKKQFDLEIMNIVDDNRMSALVVQKDIMDYLNGINYSGFM